LPVGNHIASHDTDCPSRAVGSAQQSQTTRRAKSQKDCDCGFLASWTPRLHVPASHPVRCCQRKDEAGPCFWPAATYMVHTARERHSHRTAKQVGPRRHPKGRDASSVLKKRKVDTGWRKKCCEEVIASRIVIGSLDQTSAKFNTSLIGQHKATPQHLASRLSRRTLDVSLTGQRHKKTDDFD
jgi:hypothetical protein